MRRLLDIHPKITAASVGAIFAAVILAFLQKQGVQLDVDVAEVIRDLTGLDFGTLDLSVRQAVNALAAIGVGYLWPAESAAQLEAESIEDLDESNEDDGTSPPEPEPVLAKPKPVRKRKAA